MARRRHRLFRRGGRMPYGLSLSRHAAAVHGDPDGGLVSDHRHPPTNAADPRNLPMGHLPPQPRRADARNGDPRGARLYVSRLCPRSAGPHQPGDSPAAGPAVEERPPLDRVDERLALLAAGHARDLLRRRNRHGRQHLPRGSARRADPDAVECRSQRRFFAGQSPEPLFAGHHRFGVSVRGGERRDTATESALAAVVDEAADRPAAAVSCIAAGNFRAARPGQSSGAGLSPQLWGATYSCRRESLAVHAIRRVGSFGLCRLPAAGTLRANAVSGDRQAPLPADAVAACFQLVRIGAVEGRRRGGDGRRPRALGAQDQLPLAGDPPRKSEGALRVDPGRGLAESPLVRRHKAADSSLAGARKRDARPSARGPQRKRRSARGARLRAVRSAPLRAGPGIAALREQRHAAVRAGRLSRRGAGKLSLAGRHGLGQRRRAAARRESENRALRIATQVAAGERTALRCLGTRRRPGPERCSWISSPIGGARKGAAAS